MARSPLAAISDHLDRVNGAIGRAAAWLALAVVALQFVTVALRYVFSTGSVWLTESVIYAHAALVLLTAAWTLCEEGHVRVDVFYGQAKPRRRAAIDLAGAVLLLLPFALVLIWLSLPYAARSWSILETSQESGGLPLVYLLKTLIPLFALTLALQGMSQLLRALAVLRTRGR